VAVIDSCLIRCFGALYATRCQFVCCTVDRVEFHEDQFAAVDGPATIRCHASDSTPVLWEFRRSTDRNVHHVYDRQLTSSYEHRCTINESTYDLNIHKTQLNDIGEYLCIENEGFGTKHVTKLYLTGTKRF